MNACYSYAGHEFVGAHVACCLEPLGWKRVDDVAAASVAFTYFPSMPALEDAYFDEGGLVKRAKPGTLLVDLSPSTPSFAREIAAVATVNDLRPVEAPLYVEDMTLPDAFASSSNVGCFAAGENDDVDEVIDMLETIAATVERTGACGTAQLAKAARTIQGVAAAVAAIEADALMRATHKAASSLDCLAASVHPASVGAQRMLSSVSTDSFDGMFTVEMLRGEVDAAMAAADDMDLILPQLEATHHLLEVLTVIGGSDKAPAAISLMYRDEAESAAHGLDWTRAEGLYCEDNDEYVDAPDDDYGFAGGFGGYSAN